MHLDVLSKWRQDHSPSCHNKNRQLCNKYRENLPHIINNSIIAHHLRMHQHVDTNVSIAKGMKMWIYICKNLNGIEYDNIDIQICENPSRVHGQSLKHTNGMSM